MKKVWRGGAWGTSFSTGVVRLLATPGPGWRWAHSAGVHKTARTPSEVFLPPEGTIAVARTTRGKFRSSAPRAGRRTRR